jgi:hypothetical protein
MSEIAIVLIVGFGLGYGVREWVSRRRRQTERRRRVPGLVTNVLSATIRTPPVTGVMAKFSRSTRLPRWPVFIWSSVQTLHAPES